MDDAIITKEKGFVCGDWCEDIILLSDIEITDVWVVGGRAFRTLEDAEHSIKLSINYIEHAIARDIIYITTNTKVNGTDPLRTKLASIIRTSYVEMIHILRIKDPNKDARCYDYYKFFAKKIDMGTWAGQDTKRMRKIVNRHSNLLDRYDKFTTYLLNNKLI